MVIVQTWPYLSIPQARINNLHENAITVSCIKSNNLMTSGSSAPFLPKGPHVIIPFVSDCVLHIYVIARIRTRLLTPNTAGFGQDYYDEPDETRGLSINEIREQQQIVMQGLSRRELVCAFIFFGF